MTDYTTLFFDIDNTLLDFSLAEKSAIRKILKKYNLPSDDLAAKKYSEINAEYWASFERGEIKKEEIFENRFKTLTNFFGVKKDTSKMSEDYFYFLSQGYYKIDGADDILEYLKVNGYKIYATTNGFAKTQYSRIKNSGLEKFFESVFVSEESGFQKPQKEYFEYVISKIPEKDKSKILVIGDGQNSDILGAFNAGIDSCWFNPENLIAKFKSRFQIKCLSDLKQIL